MGARRGSFGTQSRSISGSRFIKCIVGGAMPSSIAFTAQIRLVTAAPESVWPSWPLFDETNTPRVRAPNTWRTAFASVRSFFNVEVPCAAT